MKRQEIFNEKIEHFKNHPKYKWLRKYADDALTWDTMCGFYQIYAPYYNTEFGKNKLLNKFNKNIKKILKQLENNKIITKMEDDENEDCEIW